MQPSDQRHPPAQQEHAPGAGRDQDGAGPARQYWHIQPHRSRRDDPDAEGQVRLQVLPDGPRLRYSRADTFRGKITAACECLLFHCHSLILCQKTASPWKYMLNAVNEMDHVYYCC